MVVDILLAVALVAALVQGYDVNVSLGQQESVDIDYEAE